MGLTAKNALTILGLNARRINKTSVMRAYRAQALKHHPNKGGKRENFQKASNAKNVLLNYIEKHTVYSPPPPPVYLNKSVYKNFANRKNYASWNKIKTKLGRPLKINNVNYRNNETQVIRHMVEYYTALNNKKNNDMLNYLYWVAFHEHRRNKNEIIVPRRHAKQKL